MLKPPTRPDVTADAGTASLLSMPREEIDLDKTLEELDAWTNANCAEPHDEPFLDANLNPITPDELLDQIRDLERETGEKMIVDRGEHPERPA
jgi:hypothetical protein